VILPEVEKRTRELVLAELDRRGVSVTTGSAVNRITTDAIILDDDTAIDADLVIWATGATPPKLLSQLDLALDERGFIATDKTLQSTSAPGVFAVGDTGTILDASLPKAGVYAVRQGPVLWENIHRCLDGLPLEQYQPQQSFLKLINLGDGRAIGQWKKFPFSGRWVMRLKDWIDTRFMEKYQVETMTAEGAASMDGGGAEEAMQCRGCGCKLGSDVLESALESSEGIDFDDAAEIGDVGGSTLVASTDFFSAPVEDPFLAGRIAALHSASDIIATGAAVTQALANVVLPDGDRASQQRALQDFLSGARCEFDAMEATIVGGHTIVGPRMEIGFTVIGKPLGQELIRKRNLRPGDRLYLTKPLGIGVLLAAHMRSECPGRAYSALVEAMLQRQHPLAQIAVDLGVDAGTDVTGFGLAGHLVELLTASHVSAVVDLDAVPILPHAIQFVASGIESSLAPDNRRAEAFVSATDQIRQREEYRILFDPQTCGGLLLGVREDQQERFLSEVAAIGLPEPINIGRVADGGQNAKLLSIR
jgi:selenide,water dikinase